MTDIRFEQMTRWLRSDAGLAAFDIVPASGDASFRRYFRVTANGSSYIVMDAPPTEEDCAPFVRIATLMRKLGLNVPEVLASELGLGYLLLSDLGSRHYLDELNDDTADHLYGAALTALHTMQQVSVTTELMPRYTAQLLADEMMLFHHWFVMRYLAINPTTSQYTAYQQGCRLLVQSAQEQPRVWVHRDYHSRNLMVSESGCPGILDFQDAVIGPVTYDLVSLLRDCYIDWPHARVEQWLGDYQRTLEASAIIPELKAGQFKRWFDWMGMQRHLKAIGIFARLAIRDNKRGYLSDIPRTLNYLLEVSGRYDELAPLNQLLSLYRARL